MRKNLGKLFILSLLAIATQILLSSSSNGRAFSANSGNTGAPGESQTCRSCHGGGFGASVSLVVKNSQGFPVSAYVPGNTYEVEVNVNTSSGNPQRYGFQLVSLLPGNAAYNAWSSPSNNTRIANAGTRSYAEHAGKSVSSTFSVDWTAPSAGSGTVNFYAGGAAVNNNGNTLGDGGNTTSLSLVEGNNTSISQEILSGFIQMYPNPASDYLVVKNNGEQLSGLNVIIRDVKGSLLLSKSLNSRLELDLSSFDAGLYLVQFISEEGEMYTERLIVE